MKLRRNLSGIFIFDKLEGEEKPIPTCIEDCTPETRLKWLEGLEKGPLQFEIDEQLNTTWYKK